jgi:hypothetical protein
MLKQTVIAGVLLVAGTPVLLAGQPLIPPAPGSNGGAAQTVPVPPPVPGLNPQQVIPQFHSSTSQPQSATPAVPGDPLPPPVSSSPDPHSSPAVSGHPVPNHGGTHDGATMTPEAMPYYGGQQVPTYGSYGMPGFYGYPQEIPPYNSFSLGSHDLLWYQSGPAGGEHARYPYYSYRRPWYSPGPVSRNVNIVW